MRILGRMASRAAASGLGASLVDEAGVIAGFPRARPASAMRPTRLPPLE